MLALKAEEVQRAYGPDAVPQTGRRPRHSRLEQPTTPTAHGACSQTQGQARCQQRSLMPAPWWHCSGGTSRVSHHYQQLFGMAAARQLVLDVNLACSPRQVTLLGVPQRHASRARLAADADRFFASAKTCSRHGWRPCGATPSLLAPTCIWPTPACCGWRRKTGDGPHHDPGWRDSPATAWPMAGRFDIARQPQTMLRRPCLMTSGRHPAQQRRAIAKAITLLESTRTDHRCAGRRSC